jgi:hypothetical protein
MLYAALDVARWQAALTSTSPATIVGSLQICIDLYHRHLHPHANIKITSTSTFHTAASAPAHAQSREKAHLVLANDRTDAPVRKASTHYSATRAAGCSATSIYALDLRTAVAPGGRRRCWVPSTDVDANSSGGAGCTPAAGARATVAEARQPASSGT